MKFLFILIFLMSGCISTKISTKDKDGSTNILQNDFDSIDADSTGTIDKVEFYESVAEVNAQEPIFVLVTIIIAVFLCCAVTFKFSNRK